MLVSAYNYTFREVRSFQSNDEGRRELNLNLNAHAQCFGSANAQTLLGAKRGEILRKLKNRIFRRILILNAALFLDMQMCLACVLHVSSLPKLTVLSNRDSVFALPINLYLQ
jgi:hypothetical protein